jgi:hypothetical protein
MTHQPAELLGALPERGILQSGLEHLNQTAGQYPLDRICSERTSYCNRLIFDSSRKSRASLDPCRERRF